MDSFKNYISDYAAHITEIRYLTAVLLCISAIIGIVYGTIRLFTAALEQRTARRQATVAALFQSDIESSSFNREEVASALTNWVVPDCAQADPSNETDLRYVADVRESVIVAVDRFIQSGGDKRYILVLADSGMGKTTFCLNYYKHLKDKKISASVSLVPLGRPHALKNIKLVRRKNETVLLLDALDEDAAAIADGGDRVRELMKAAADFRAVIITCRSQFFENDAAIPTATGVAVIRPRKGGEEGEYRFYKLYLLPFTADQIEIYIKRHFHWWGFRGLSYRASARRLVQEIPELTVRPMLLALIPDLIESKRQIRELFDLYGFMVEKWLRRESTWIEESKLFNVSKSLSIFVYIGSIEVRRDRVTVDELKEIANLISPGDEDWQHLTSRSLLNRDSLGLFKFAHRSIMEYLFVCAAIEGWEGCFSVPWTDLMRELFLSWGRTKTGAANAARAEEILKMDLRATRLVPLSVPLPRPRLINVHELNKESLGRKGKRSGKNAIPLSWRLPSLRLIEDDYSYLLFDFQYDLTWQIARINNLPIEDRHIYRSSSSDIIAFEASDP